MVKLIVMCGLQCSGKSTKARELGDEYNAQVLSSDYIREQHPDWDNENVFRNLYQMMNFFLSENQSVIIDATNVTIKSRRQIFQNIKHPCDKICHIMNVPYDTCVERLHKRNQSDYPHKFDEEVIKKYYYSFEIPFYEEGWDEIKVENIPTITDASNYMNLVQEKAEKFDQQNMHHTQNLGQHMDTVGGLLEEIGMNDIIVRAGYFHDVGKLFTQIFKEGDENAHYYSHANVGAYKLLCKAGIYEKNSVYDFEKETIDDYHFYDTNTTLEWLFYINYHMHLFNVTTDKSIKKWCQIFGEEKFSNLKLFNKCDKTRETDTTEFVELLHKEMEELIKATKGGKK